MAPPSKKPARPRGAGTRPGAGASRQAGTNSRPARSLAVMAVLLIVMFLTIIGGTLVHPGEWHSKFKVVLGLDLHGGTSITLKAVSPNGGVPTQAAMNQAIGILTQRFEPLGVSNIQIQQQGSQIINVSIPGKSANEISSLLTAAALRFRQVLLCTTLFPGSPSVSPGPQCATTTKGPKAKAGLPGTAPVIQSTSPSPSPSSSGSSSPSPSPSSSGKSSAKTSSPSPSASSSGGSGQAVSAKRLGTSSPSASASPSPSDSASPSPSASGSASPSPSPSASPTVTFYVTGDQALVKKSVLAQFKKLNCNNPNWQQTIYGNKSSEWNNPNSQIVACDKQGMKYVLGPAIVSGRELTSESAGLLNNEWVVNFSFNGKGTKAFGAKTLAMNGAYWTGGSSGYQTSVLNQFAIVLDGKIISAPTVTQAITQGSGQISGNFTSKSASNLANVLKYGQLPISFKGQTTDSISAELGGQQLDAGLIAAAVGLLLVVFYSIMYYRGLAIVSVCSLALAALLSWLSVILLGRYIQYTLTLAGVAGLIVAIGITADSFVVYFERLRDEVREGRSLRAAVERGWERARRTILVSDTVSFLAALLLYIFAIGDVRGFAFTLGLTTLIDIVVVFLFTKPMVTLLARTDFFGRGHKWSGLDPARLGGRAPWRGSRTAQRPASGTATATARPTPKEA